MAFRNPGSGGIIFGDPGTPPPQNISEAGKDLEIIADQGVAMTSGDNATFSIGLGATMGSGGPPFGGTLQLLPEGFSLLGDAILSGQALAVVEAPDSGTHEVALRLGIGAALLRLLNNGGDPNIALHFNSATPSFVFNNPAGAAKRSMDILETGGLDAGNPPANFGRLFTRKVAGKMTLQVRFPSGASQLLATEP